MVRSVWRCLLYIKRLSLQFLVRQGNQLKLLQYCGNVLCAQCNNSIFAQKRRHGHMPTCTHILLRIIKPLALSSPRSAQLSLSLSLGWLGIKQ